MCREARLKQPLVPIGMAVILFAASACTGPDAGVPAAAGGPPPATGMAERAAQGDPEEPQPPAGVPNVTQDSQTGAAEVIALRATTAIAALDLPEAASWDVEFRTEDPDLLFACDYIPNSGRGEGPLLTCEFGESEANLVGYAEFWKDGGVWQADLSPDYGDAYSVPIQSSAATPGVPPGKALENAEHVLERARQAVQALDLSGAEAGYRELRITDPNLIFTCQYSPGRGGDEVPILACKFGEFHNEVRGHALFWHDGGDWRAQLYPQAPENLAWERYRLFGALGSNCPVGCGSEFRAVRQQGPEALVVVDLSGVSTRSNHEVHLLRREGDEWRVLWAPLPRDFGYRFRPSQVRTPVVSAPEEGIDRFDVRYEDGAVETWVRTGDAYARQPAQP